MSETKPDAFDSWALVELFGRQRIVGRVSEAVISGGNFVRVDVPADEGRPAFTRFYGPSAIYCISPVVEQVAMELLRQCRNEPVSRWDVPQLAEKYGHREEESP